MDYNALPTKEIIDTTISALNKHNFNAQFAANSEEAKQKVFRIIPQGANVLTMTSVTLDTLGISSEINESGKFDSQHKKIFSLDHDKEADEIKRLRMMPDWSIGSAHAVTEDGKIIIASRTGSQIPAHSFGANHVVFVVGAQKIVKDLDQGIDRIYKHSLPLESERAHKAYGVEGSSVNRILVLNQVDEPQKYHIILVNEVVGF